MKLLIVGHPFLLAYNQQKYVAMKKLGAEIRMVVPRRGCDRFDTTDYQIHSSLTRREVVPLRSCWQQSHMTYLHSPLSIARILRDFKPDVIHIEEEPQALLTVEVIVLQRLFAPWARVSLFTWDNLLRQRRFPFSGLKSALRRYSLERASVVVCGNRRAAELLRKEGYFQGQVEILPQYGSDTAIHLPGSEQELRLKLGLESAIVVSFVGRLVPEKGLRLLLSALSNLVSLPWKLLLVGSGPLAAEIREKWMPALPNRIVMVQAVEYAQVPRYLRCSDIFVLPSFRTERWMEQFGLALSQAMLLGIPGIGSSSGAIPEVLGRGGIVFREGDVADLERAIEDLLRSPERREELGRQGREVALACYTEEIVAAKYMQSFERALCMAGHNSMDQSMLGRQVL